MTTTAAPRTTAPAASAIREFRLPDLGEGLTEGEILQWLVAPGDEVVINQPVVEVETAKAAVELPSPFAGVVTELTVEAGQTVDVGSVIIRFAVEGADVSGATAAAAPGAPDPVSVLAGEAVPAEAAELVPQPPPTREAVLVGYGVRADGPRRRRPRLSASAAPVVPAEAAALPTAPAMALTAPAASVAPAPGLARVSVLAKPPVRKLARDLGVDLAGVSGSGPGGVVTRDDVQRAALIPAGQPTPEAAPAPLPAPTGSSAASAYPVEHRIPVKGVRKAMAAAMVESAFTAPHVTLFLTVDVTESMRLVERWRGSPDFDGVRVTPLLLVAKALVTACRRTPEINARWDEAAQEIVVPGQVNLGIAAATPRGLIVPNIPAADRLSMRELAAALGELTATARAGRTTPAQMQGGTISITNVGSLGVDNGTPIINPGEAAILCFGAVTDRPWVHAGEIAVRKVTQLTLSFDHRIVDGAMGARVLADIGAVLEDPARLLAWS